jgi:hypothetical protein
MGRDTRLTYRSAQADRVTLNIGLREVISFEDERLSECLRQGTRIAVSEVETRRVAPFPVFPEGPSRQIGLLFVYGRQGNVRLCDEKIEVSDAIPTGARFEDHRALDKRSG